MDNYIELALRTEKIPEDPPFGVFKYRLIHMTLGLVSEINEIQDSTKYDPWSKGGIVEEVGDAFWYVGIMFHILDDEQDFYEALHTDDDDTSMAYSTSVIADAVKAHIIYGKELDHELVLAHLIFTVNRLRYFVSGFDINLVLEANIRKLAARYPNKYSDFHALHRDTDQEMKNMGHG